MARLRENSKLISRDLSAPVALNDLGPSTMRSPFSVRRESIRAFPFGESCPTRLGRPGTSAILTDRPDEWTRSRSVVQIVHHVRGFSWDLAGIQIGHQRIGLRRCMGEICARFWLLLTTSRIGLARAASCRIIPPVRVPRRPATMSRAPDSVLLRSLRI